MSKESGKITKVELQKIKDQQTKIGNILHQIGILESNKHQKLHDLAEINKEIDSTKQKLEEKYGSINVDLETGSWKKIKETEDV